MFARPYESAPLLGASLFSVPHAIISPLRYSDHSGKWEGKS